MGKAATRVLVYWLIAVGSSVCFAQGNFLQNPAPNKKACDFLSKSEAESILGQPVEARGDGVYQCKYVETGWTNKPPKNKLVSFMASYSATPKANAYAETRKNLFDSPVPSMVVKDVPDFADAAIWMWIPGHGGTLYASPTLGKSSETVRPAPAPVPRPAPDVDDPIGGGGFIRRPSGY